MNLTAKNIKHFNTDDGVAWDASFYLDGKKIGNAQDQGHGGEVNTRSLDPVALQKIADYAKTLPHFGLESGMDLAQNAAMVLENVVFDTLAQKRTKSILKSKIVAKMPDGLFQWKISKNHTFETMVKAVKTKHPTAIILNELPFTEAHKILNP